MNQVTPYNTAAGKKKEVEDMFDNIAPKYDLLNHVLSMKIDVLWRNTLVKWMNADQPKEVLDVATGTGDLAIAVQKGTGAKIVGLDLSQQMLNVGIDKIKKISLTDQIEMIKGDAENLPFESNKFDFIYSASAFHWIPEQIGYEKVYSMLKNGGAFARFANHPFRDKFNPDLSEEIDRIYEKHYYTYYKTEPRKIVEYTEKEALDRAMLAKKYGFEDIKYITEEINQIESKSNSDKE
mgnify:CR=1 FL=1